MILGEIASMLKVIAERNRIPVLCINQVTTAFRGAYTHTGIDPATTPLPVGGRGGGGARHIAALGPLWAHAVNTRLVLERSAAGRRVILAKSPLSPSVALSYEVTSGGIVAPDDAQLEAVEPGSVVEFEISVLGDP